MLDVGDSFPHFIFPDENGEIFDSKYLEGIRYIVYFYPKDNTSGCTKEAQTFNEVYTKLMIRNVPVIGISKDSPESHRKFIAKNDLKFKLLSDSDHTLMEQVGAWGKKMMYGKEVEGTIRSTFIIGKDGKVEACWYKVKVDGHADTVYSTVKSLMQ
ncbi:MAG: peroxiredoxin [Candidatus Methanarcanum hacksteinii]|nr:peroxiredoxin [Candidatus Methanarcanum hacksteinii]